MEDLKHKTTTPKPKGLVKFDSIDARTRDATCRYHGKYASKQFRLLDRWSPWSPCPQCENEKKIKNEQRLRDRNSAESSLKAYRLRDLLVSNAGVPGRFLKSTTDNFIANCDKSESYRKFCEAYIKNFPEYLEMGSGLIFCGNTGAGKTHLACAIANGIIDLHVSTVKYTTAMKMLRQIRDTYSDRSKKETDEIQLFTSPSLLVIDEVGVQNNTDNEKVVLFEIINDRYVEMKPTILISNLSIQNLKQYIGERVVDRMKDGGGKLMVFDWASYRGVKN